MENKICCKVEECYYNNGDQCSAEVVDVRSCGCAHVTDCNETACKTFRRA